MATDITFNDAKDDIEWICKTMHSIMQQQQKIGKMQVLAKNLERFNTVHCIDLAYDINEEIGNMSWKMMKLVLNLREVIIDGYCESNGFTEEQRSRFVSECDDFRISLP
tara:strand:+ start:955 stop:1281 length:327 start_codon:yes stop_codon:yes gene_type:complete